MLVVSLWVDPTRVEEFEAFERRAASIMRRHGGAIEQAIRLDSERSAEGDPFEMHVVAFPDEAAFNRYRSDPEIQELGATRSEVIRKTTIFVGSESERYSEHTAGLPPVD